jgi:hypothetical protein
MRRARALAQVKIDCLIFAVLTGLQITPGGKTHPVVARSWRSGVFIAEKTKAEEFTYAPFCAVSQPLKPQKPQRNKDLSQRPHITLSHDTKLWRRCLYRFVDVALGQVAIMFFHHGGGGVAQVARHHH